MFLHGIVPHSHASQSSHPAVICEQEASLVHKFIDLLSVDIGVNHLEDYVVNQAEDFFTTNLEPLLLFIHFINSAVCTEPLLTYFQTQNIFLLKNQLYSGVVTRRGPPLLN
jgi:hypothetical protein